MRTRKELLLALAAAAAATPLRASAQTPALTEIGLTTVGPGAPEWGFYIGEDKGFFARAGLRIDETIAGNVQNCVNAVVTGDVPLAVLASDIVIVANANHLPLKYIAPLVTIPTYKLVVRPEIKSWSDLRDKIVLLTNKQDITAITFRRMAEAQHLDWQKDFDLILSGNSQLRVSALIAGSAQGAMLTQPYDIYAERQGMKVLSNATDVMKDWISNGLAANATWAAAHRGDLVSLLRVLRTSTEYGYAHPAEAVAIMAQKLKVDPSDAQISYDSLFKTGGMSRDLIVNEKALENVISGVVQMGSLQAPIPVSELVDTSYAREALGR